MSKSTPILSNNDRQNDNVLAVVLMLMIFSLSSAASGLSSQVSPAKPLPPPKSSKSIEPNGIPEEAAASKLQMPFAQPVAISIPSINVQSELIEVGKNPDGTIEIPSGENFDKAAWYKHGAAPGQIGSAVIEGHVDSVDNGPSVFFSLGAVKPGESFHVDRADGFRAVFVIDSVEQFTKDNFPTEAVYGAKNYAGLTLITCGGDFNKDTGEYESNIVVTSHLKQVLSVKTLATKNM